MQLVCCCLSDYHTITKLIFLKCYYAHVTIIARALLAFGSELGNCWALIPFLGKYYCIYRKDKSAHVLKLTMPYQY